MKSRRGSGFWVIAPDRLPGLAMARDPGMGHLLQKEETRRWAAGYVEIASMKGDTR